MKENFQIGIGSKLNKGKKMQGFGKRVEYKNNWLAFSRGLKCIERLPCSTTKQSKTTVINVIHKFHEDITEFSETLYIMTVT